MNGRIGMEKRTSSLVGGRKDKCSSRDSLRWGEREKMRQHSFFPESEGGKGYLEA